ncbi:TIGR01777 family oxidoreductase [Polyangium sorediatum]|uniref:TIGR01777 family oxidoreductase n=1 Tax=Polyangium sorediatum TaxID=889274 RepID=A0ABT6PAE4_9BACT|nr:TIGR01777 family oxidoreductase [Polyangium sorediatum]MDI1437222.1 TIGR01777 family oxidoreductase [Polyangium sorediatum]
MVKSAVVKTVLLTGGTGFIGRRLTETLLQRGDRVTVLTRDPDRARGKLPRGATAVAWDPEHEGPWLDEVGRASAIVHLAGEPVAQRWTDEARRAIVASRVDSTRLVVEGIRRAEKKPEVFVCASAVGYYGPRPPNEALDETGSRGEGFLADVVERWEAEAAKAEALGVRTVMLRIGVVLGEGGGALEKMLLPFKMFAGGPIAPGSQVIAWVHAEDVVGLALLALNDARARGPINVVSPEPATSKELATAIGRVMHRPSWFTTPELAVKVALGSEAVMILTTGQRVVPARAKELGYVFQYPALVPALASILTP